MASVCKSAASPSLATRFTSGSKGCEPVAQRTHTVKRYSYNFDAKSGGPGLLQLSSDTAIVADVRFYADGTPRATNRFGPNLAWAQLYFWLSAFPGLVDMLRHEGPVYVHLNDDPNYGYAVISTAGEPVGEAEV